MEYTFTAKSESILHVEETGSGPPVLALHGIGGGAYFFTGLAKRLSAAHRMFAIDLPGTGRSTSAPASFTLESWIADIGDLVREKIGEPVILVGHSFGTILALQAWATWPEQIRAIVFTCGLPKARPNIHERLTLRADAIAKHGIANWGPKVSPGVFSKTTLAEQPEMVALFERLFEAQRGPEYVREIELLLAADLNPVVPSVTVPCLAIAGRHDSYAPPEAVAEFAAQLGVTCRVEILEHSAHLPFFEEPLAYATAVSKGAQIVSRIG
jgi:pimeloyl-ACP methyl ester carboxylesterase